MSTNRPPIPSLPIHEKQSNSPLPTGLESTNRLQNIMQSELQQTHEANVSFSDMMPKIVSEETRADITSAKTSDIILNINSAVKKNTKNNKEKKVGKKTKNAAKTMGKTCRYCGEALVINAKKTQLLPSKPHQMKPVIRRIRNDIIYPCFCHSQAHRKCTLEHIKSTLETHCMVCLAHYSVFGVYRNIARQSLSTIIRTMLIFVLLVVTFVVVFSILNESVVQMPSNTKYAIMVIIYIVVFAITLTFFYYVRQTFCRRELADISVYCKQEEVEHHLDNEAVRELMKEFIAKVEANHQNNNRASAVNNFRARIIAGQAPISINVESPLREGSLRPFGSIEGASIGPAKSSDNSSFMNSKHRGQVMDTKNPAFQAQAEFLQNVRSDVTKPVDGLTYTLNDVHQERPKVFTNTILQRSPEPRDWESRSGEDNEHDEEAASQEQKQDNGIEVEPEQGEDEEPEGSEVNKSENSPPGMTASQQIPAKSLIGENWYPATPIAEKVEEVAEPDDSPASRMDSPPMPQPWTRGRNEDGEDQEAQISSVMHQEESSNHYSANPLPDQAEHSIWSNFTSQMKENEAPDLRQKSGLPMFMQKLNKEGEPSN